MPDAPKYRFLSSISSVSFASTADTLPPSFVRQLGHRELSSFALDAKKKLSGHWDRVALALENGKRQPHHFISRVQSLWNEVPLAADEMESAADTTAQTLRTRLDVVTDELRSAEERANRQEQLYDRVQEQIDDLGSALNSKLSGIEAELSTLNPSLSTITLKVASLRSQADLAASASAARHSKLVGADAKISQKLDDIYRNVRRRRRLKKLLKKIASVGAFAKISSAKEVYQALVVQKSPYADDFRGSVFFDVAF
jgi:chromosome segregation ATPase